MLRPRIPFWLLILFLTSATAQADVVSETFGPGNSYLTNTLRAVSGSSSLLGYNGVGITFVPGATLALTDIELAMRHVAGTNSYTISLSPDVAGQPGAPLESWTLSLPTTPSVVPLTSSANPLLAAGATYWLTAQPTVNTQIGYWFVNDQNTDTGNMKWQTGSTSGSWGPVANRDVAYRVSGVAPEPSALALLALGAPALTRRRRR